ncbi:MAG: hypothetical protein M3Y54_18240 [Bacteroidota bacterium]|nr:hypothetical protein [Bacteroidota bacterium]
MKKSVILAPLLFLLLLGCKKVENQVAQILKFTVNVSQVSRVPGPSLFFTALPAPVTIVTNSSTAFNSNNTNSSKVQDVYLDQLQLTLLNPTTAVPNFNFLDLLRVYINTPGASNRILLAEITNPPQDQTTLTLVPTTARLDEYLKSDKYELTVYSQQKPTYGGISPLDSLTIRTDARFRVTASPL